MALDLPEDLAWRFAVVFASHGMPCWVNSAQARMRSAANCLRPGGALVLTEIHPLVGMVVTGSR
jgi:SAM-dependent methyltransferase